jgi:hypothetical protein
VEVSQVIERKGTDKLSIFCMECPLWRAELYT